MVTHLQALCNATFMSLFGFNGKAKLFLKTQGLQILYQRVFQVVFPYVGYKIPYTSDVTGWKRYNEHQVKV